MQSHVDLTHEHGLVLPSDNHDRVSDTYVLRKTVGGLNRPLKDGPLEPFGLPMDLHRLHVLTPQVRGQEGLGGRVAIDEDRVIADRTGQDVEEGTEDRKVVGLSLLSTLLWFCKWTS